MINPEGPNTTEYFYQKAIEFMKLGTQRGVSNFLMSGPGDVPTYYRDFAALFPSATGELTFAIVGATPNRNQQYYYDRILALQLPERVKALRIVEDALVRLGFEATFSLNGLPLIVLAFGETRDTQEENVVLFCAAGRSPESALTILQERVRERKKRLN